MARKGTQLSAEAAAKQANAIDAWHRENTEILKFSIRVKKGCSGALRELAARRGVSLTSIIRKILITECQKEGIEI